MKFLTVGKLTKNKDEVKAAVEELGGKITSTTNKASFCLSTKSELPLKYVSTWREQPGKIFIMECVEKMALIIFKINKSKVAAKCNFGAPLL